MTDAATRQRNKEVIRAMEDALNRRDFHAMAMLYDESVRHQGASASRADFIRTFEDIATTFPDWTTTIDRLFAEDDWVVELMHVSGTHLAGPATPHHGDLRGVDPTGKAFDVRQSHYWRLREGLIVEHEVVRDDLGLHRQLGLAPSRPGSDR